MTGSDNRQFWEKIYREKSSYSNGEPGQILREIVDRLAPGHALELGCAKGDDAVWLAQQGWGVLAVDISSVVLGYAAANAQKDGVADRISFAQYDLASSFPDGEFDLVTASFLYSPTGDFTRTAVLRRAAEAVSPDGHLLIIDHGSRAPWSWAATDTVYPTADETFASLELPSQEWEILRVAGAERAATGPNGQTAAVVDNLIFVRRK